MMENVIETLLADPNRQVEARARLRDEIDSEPTTLTYFKWAKALANPGLSRKVALVSSFTIETLAPYLIVETFLAGCPASPQFVQYGLWENALREPGFFRDDTPDALVLLLHEEAFGHAGGVAAADARDRFAAAVDAFRSHTEKPLVIALLDRPADPNVLWRGIMPKSEASVISQFSAVFPDIIERHNELYALSLAEWLTAGHGDWYDQSGALSNLSLVSRKAQPTMARGIARTLACLFRPRRKLLSVDLDNTIWGGIVGEDGVDGVDIGENWPGSAFLGFQKFLGSLRDVGVLLVINSKNNEADAREVFEARSEMHLAWDDFSARRINWQNKAGNLIEIANELGLGLDSFVFADDSPVECALVRKLLPEVEVVELGNDPEKFVENVLRTGAFDTLSVSTEDLNRADGYLAEKKRQTILEKTGDFNGFLESLELKLTISPVDSNNAERAHQLINKTNQFNLSLERLDLSQVRVVGEDAEWIFSIRLSDKFGDYGIVGILHLQQIGTVLQIRNMTLSCRALGRQVENALISFCYDWATSLGLKALEARYVEGPRNQQVLEFLNALKFVVLNTDPGVTVFRLPLDSNAASWPKHIDFTSPN